MVEAPDVAAVILYHFTTIGNLGMIRAHGLTRGRVELSHDPQDYVNAISSTTSPLPVGLGLDLGPDELTEVDRIRTLNAPAFFRPREHALRIRKPCGSSWSLNAMIPP
ncbi:MAG TPA: hypothetical protein VFE29_00390 [Terriglobia bacterium]|jgi:hypothetical protein|nr:hypothetical protein [Terriglobia bacterium]